MYERSKHLDTFFVAGFQNYDGALVLDELKPGTPLSLCPEPDNPHDPDAIALYFKTSKLGYVPRSSNELIAQLAYFGHADVFECHVLQVDPMEAPWEQVRVGLFVSDAREQQ